MNVQIKLLSIENQILCHTHKMVIYQATNQPLRFKRIHPMKKSIQFQENIPQEANLRQRFHQVKNQQTRRVSILAKRGGRTVQMTRTHLIVDLVHLVNIKPRYPSNCKQNTINTNTEDFWCNIIVYDLSSFSFFRVPKLKMRS